MRSGGTRKILRAGAGILAAGALTLALCEPASAGLFERLFGGITHALRAPHRLTDRLREFVEPAAPPYGRGQERTVESAPIHIDRGKTYCVRICDGHFFPVPAHRGLSSAEACRAFCPGSPTKVYSGGTIGDAVAQDGSHYSDLDHAFLYRKHLVAGCTCNGHDPFGLAHVDPHKDPTLRPGDVVATKNGLAAFTGRKDNEANFTPAGDYRHFSQQYRDQLSDMRIRSAQR
jgi:hypothetical protein